jgi:hypothetical protein
MPRLLESRILHKGLRLVLIPLFFATVCFLVLGYLWLSSENLADKEAHQRDFAMALGLATEARHVVILEMMSRMFDPNRDWQGFATYKHNSLLFYYAILRKESENDPNRLKIIDEIEKMSETEWRVLNTLPKAEPGSSMLENLAACRKMPALLQLGANNGIAI